LIVLKSVTVYCGSADGLDERYTEAAMQMGAALANQSITLVYGGGKTGLMGAVADGALAAGGKVVGVIPESMNTPALAQTGLTRLEVTPDIQTRFSRMVDLADAFIALPGGYGTLDELFQTLTWAQIGVHSKPVGLLNIRGYYEPLLAMLDHILSEKFIYPEHRGWTISAQEPEELLQALCAFQPPVGIERWMTRED
jgi:uncharacterized protein (TIGR00730 family)